MQDQNAPPAVKNARRGYISPGAVKGFAFFVITLCIVLDAMKCSSMGAGVSASGVYRFKNVVISVAGTIS